MRNRRTAPLNKIGTVNCNRSVDRFLRSKHGVIIRFVHDAVTPRHYEAQLGSHRLHREAHVRRYLVPFICDRMTGHCKESE
jgi:hypothetical protein